MPRRARAALLLALACAGPLAGGAAPHAEPLRSLDAVVKDLLERNCIRLRAGDPPEVFVGELETLCAHIIQGAPPISAASGGGAATPGSASRLIQQLLRGGDLAASGDAPTLQFGDRLQLFVLGGWGGVDRQETEFEDAYDSTLRQAVIGASYDLLPGLQVGLAFNYSDEDGRYAGGGDFETEQFGIGAFARVQPLAPITIDLAAGYARQGRERSRLAVYEEFDRDDPTILTFRRQGLVRADYNADVFDLGISMAGSWRLGAVTLTPLAGLALRRTDYASYSESGDTGLELRFEQDDQTSLLSSVGLGAATVVSVGTVTLLPQIRFSWLHEFEDDQRTIKARFVDDPRDVSAARFTFGTDPPDRNFYRLGGGVSVALPNGLQPFVQAETLLGHHLYDSWSVTLGVSFRL